MVGNCVPNIFILCDCVDDVDGVQTKQNEWKYAKEFIAIFTSKIHSQNYTTMHHHYSFGFSVSSECFFHCVLCAVQTEKWPKLSPRAFSNALNWANTIEANWEWDRTRNRNGYCCSFFSSSNSFLFLQTHIKQSRPNEKREQWTETKLTVCIAQCTHHTHIYQLCRRKLLKISKMNISRTVDILTKH